MRSLEPKGQSFIKLEESFYAFNPMLDLVLAFRALDAMHRRKAYNFTWYFSLERLDLEFETLFLLRID